MKEITAAEAVNMGYTFATHEDMTRIWFRLWGRLTPFDVVLRNNTLRVPHESGQLLDLCEGKQLFEGASDPSAER